MKVHTDSVRFMYVHQHCTVLNCVTCPGENYLRTDSSKLATELCAISWRR